MEVKLLLAAQSTSEVAFVGFHTRVFPPRVEGNVKSTFQLSTVEITVSSIHGFCMLIGGRWKEEKKEHASCELSMVDVGIILAVGTD